jgi:hypothetical protein
MTLSFPRSTRQFTLASLLAFVTVAAIGAAAYGSWQRSLRAQERAIDEITAKGGIVYVYSEGCSVYFQRPFATCGTGLKRVIGPRRTTSNFVDGDLNLLNDVIDLSYVDFAGSAITTEGRLRFRQSHPRIVANEKPY